MPLITKITAQKSSEERFNVFMNDGSGEKFAFSVDQNILLKFGLRKGLELDEMEILEIQYGDSIKKAFNKAIEYLGFRMRSEKEVADMLLKKEYEEAVITEVIHQLRHYKYVNDEEFADAYIRTHWKTGGKGPGVIKRELAMKGIGKEIAEKSLLQYSKEDQFEQAMIHAEKIVRKESKISTVQIKQKVEQTLMRKGFSYDVISIVIEELTYENNDDEEWNSLVLQAEKLKRKYAKEVRNQYKMKMKQALYRKGFSIELIDRFLNEEEQD
ncbi:MULTISPECIES: recombination regulator RecX [Bacillaceae]|uniref:recombination regulator RecX n=1 Tax=Bacillaceae TaxID=186817 RepID=UPI000C768E06|nr:MULTISPECIES: recombination regulator RecX [Bacillaceae]PLR66611.1 recombination regulator RecX [Bacillus sp. UMB0893]